MQQYLTLYTYINHLRRRNIPIERPPFRYLKKPVLYSFNTRIIALFLIYIRDRLNVYKEGTVKRYIRSLTPEQFLQHIKNIRVVGFSSKVGRKTNKLVSLQPSTRGGSRVINQLLKASSSTTITQPAQIVNIEFFNYIWYLQVVKIYKVLKYAIKHADIGLLKYIIAHFYLYFTRLKSNNHASKIIYLQRLIITEVYNPVLQWAILINGLINNCRELNIFFKAN